MRQMSRVFLPLVPLNLLQGMFEYRKQCVHALSNCIWVPRHVDDLISQREILVVEAASEHTLTHVNTIYLASETCFDFPQRASKQF